MPEINEEPVVEEWDEGSYWQYRIVHTHYRIIRSRGNTYETDTYNIHEVWFNSKDELVGLTEDATFPQGESQEEFRSDMANYLKALERPIVEYSELGGEPEIVHDMRRGENMPPEKGGESDSNEQPYYGLTIDTPEEGGESDSHH